MPFDFCGSYDGCREVARGEERITAKSQGTKGPLDGAPSQHDNHRMGMIPSLTLALWVGGGATAPADHDTSPNAQGGGGVTVPSGATAPKWVDPFDSPPKAAVPGNPSPSPRSKTAVSQDEVIQKWMRTHPAEMAVVKTNPSYPKLTREVCRCIDSYAASHPGLGASPVSRISSCMSDESTRIHEEELGRAQATEVLKLVETREADVKRKAEAQRGYEEHLPAALKWMGAVLGYRVAIAEDSRREALAEIAKEKKYAKYGGVFDKAAVYESQQQIRTADEEIARLKQFAKKNQAKVLGRNHPQMLRAEECLTEGMDNDDCEWVRVIYEKTAPEDGYE